MPDYYEILGVPRNASEAEIRSANRRLLREYHPDVNPDNPAAEDKAKAVNEAFSVLIDPAKKELYDRFGTKDGETAPSAGGNNQTGPAARTTGHANNMWGDWGNWGGLGDWASMFGNFATTQTGARPPTPPKPPENKDPNREGMLDGVDHNALTAAQICDYMTKNLAEASAGARTKGYQNAYRALKVRQDLLRDDAVKAVMLKSAIQGGALSSAGGLGELLEYKVANALSAEVLAEAIRDNNADVSVSDTDAMRLRKENNKFIVTLLKHQKTPLAAVLKAPILTALQQPRQCDTVDLGSILIEAQPPVLTENDLRLFQRVNKEREEFDREAGNYFIARAIAKQPAFVPGLQLSLFEAILLDGPSKSGNLDIALLDNANKLTPEPLARFVEWHDRKPPSFEKEETARFIERVYRARPDLRPQLSSDDAAPRTDAARPAMRI